MRAQGWSRATTLGYESQNNLKAFRRDEPFQGFITLFYQSPRVVAPLQPRGWN